jgi:glyoxylate reductase
MEKVVITRQIPENGVDILKSIFNVYMNENDRNMTKKEIKDAIKDAYGIVSMVSDPIDREVIDSAKNLKIIANYGVGINNVDIEYATQKGILFTNTPGVLTQSTAELGWALIMAAARLIPQADKLTRDGKFNGFAPTLMLGQELYGKTIGVVGMGKIGSSIAKIARFGFNMNVLYFNRSVSDKELLVDAKKVELNRLLQESDVVVLTTPLNDQSRYLIGEDEFGLMKNTSVFVNIARGEVVDTNALIDALSKGKVFSCGLDVYENEPNFDKRLLGFDNCILLPHIGSATHKTRQKMSEIVANNILSVYHGKCPDFAVNGDVLCNAKG